MDEEDFRAIIAVLIGELRDIGAGDIADEAHYVETDSETGEARLLPPQARTFQMLLAFERFLAVRDGQVARSALVGIQQLVRSEGPIGAVVVTTAEAEREGIEVDLLQTPDLTELRNRVRILALQLGSPDSEPEPEPEPLRRF